MSIATEITRLQTAKADLKTAIEGKGVTVPSATKIDGYADLVGAIQTGGGGEDREDLVEAKDVDFIDFDGRLLYSYTASEFANLSALPANPTYPGLVAQGWNWTLADAKEFVAEYGALVIGQNYTTDNGRTRLYIHIPEQAFDFYDPVTLTVNLTSNATGSPVFYWGDGTSSVWGGTRAGDQAGTSHNYTAPGDYIIKIEVSDDAVVTYLGWNGARNSILDSDEYKQKWLRKVEVGDRVTGLARNVFKRCDNLETISLPVTMLKVEDYDETLFGRQALHNKAIVFPINFTTSRNRAWFQTLCGLKYISIPKGMHGLSIPPYPVLLRKLIIPSYEPSKGQTSSIKLYDVPTLTHFVLGGTYTDMVTDLCRASKIKKLYIPATVTRINATAFQYNDQLKEVRLKPTTPPTLAHTNAFNGINSECIFYVPYSSDHSILAAYQSATNWSSFASKMVEESE